MSNNNLIIEERSRNIGQFMVGRLLPFVEKRAVGPFVFIDHMGPSTIGDNGIYMDIDQHPHIGLSTLTYLYEGEVEHKDSTGANQIIAPGSVNLMVAGRGVTHTERTPKHLRNGNSYTMHGYQIWIALPEEFELIEPKFYHISENQIPTWNQNGLQMRLIVGEVLGHKSPTPFYSPSYMIDIEALENTYLDLSGQLFGEIGIVIVSGSLIIKEEDSDNSTEIKQSNMLISKVRDFCKLELKKGTKLLIFGGEPLSKRYMFWNFVASNNDLLEKAKQDWKDHNFPKVPNDETYIPLP